MRQGGGVSFGRETTESYGHGAVPDEELGDTAASGHGWMAPQYLDAQAPLAHGNSIQGRLRLKHKPAEMPCSTMAEMCQMKVRAFLNRLVEFPEYKTKTIQDFEAWIFNNRGLKFSDNTRVSLVVGNNNNGLIFEIGCLDGNILSCISALRLLRKLLQHEYCAEADAYLRIASQMDTDTYLRAMRLEKFFYMNFCNAQLDACYVLDALSRTIVDFDVRSVLSWDVRALQEFESWRRRRHALRVSKFLFPVNLVSSLAPSTYTNIATVQQPDTASRKHLSLKLTYPSVLDTDSTEKTVSDIPIPTTLYDGPRDDTSLFCSWRNLKIPSLFKPFKLSIRYRLLTRPPYMQSGSLSVPGPHTLHSGRPESETAQGLQDWQARHALFQYNFTNDHTIKSSVYRSGKTTGAQFCRRHHTSRVALSQDFNDVQEQVIKDPSISSFRSDKSLAAVTFLSSTSASSCVLPTSQNNPAWRSAMPTSPDIVHVQESDTFFQVEARVCFPFPADFIACLLFDHRQMIKDVISVRNEILSSNGKNNGNAGPFRPLIETNPCEELTETEIIDLQALLNSHWFTKVRAYEENTEERQCLICRKYYCTIDTSCPPKQTAHLQLNRTFRVVKEAGLHKNSRTSSVFQGNRLGLGSPRRAGCPHKHKPARAESRRRCPRLIPRSGATKSVPRPTVGTHIRDEHGDMSSIVGPREDGKAFNTTRNRLEPSSSDSLRHVSYFQRVTSTHCQGDLWDDNEDDDVGSYQSAICEQSPQWAFSATQNSGTLRHPSDCSSPSPFPSCEEQVSYFVVRISIAHHEDIASFGSSSAAARLVFRTSNTTSQRPHFDHTTKSSDAAFSLFPNNTSLKSALARKYNLNDERPYSIPELSPSQLHQTCQILDGSTYHSTATAAPGTETHQSDTPKLPQPDQTTASTFGAPFQGSLATSKVLGLKNTIKQDIATPKSSKQFRTEQNEKEEKQNSSLHQVSTSSSQLLFEGRQLESTRRLKKHISPGSTSSPQRLSRGSGIQTQTHTNEPNKDVLKPTTVTHIEDDPKDNSIFGNEVYAEKRTKKSSSQELNTSLCFDSLEHSRPSPGSAVIDKCIWKSQHTQCTKQNRSSQKTTSCTAPQQVLHASSGVLGKKCLHRCNIGTSCLPLQEDQKTPPTGTAFTTTAPRQQPNATSTLDLPSTQGVASSIRLRKTPENSGSLIQVASKYNIPNRDSPEGICNSTGSCLACGENTTPDTGYLQPCLQYMVRDIPNPNFTLATPRTFATSAGDVSESKSAFPEGSCATTSQLGCEVFLEAFLDSKLGHAVGAEMLGESPEFFKSLWNLVYLAETLYPTFLKQQKSTPQCSTALTLQKIYNTAMSGTNCFNVNNAN